MLETPGAVVDKQSRCDGARKTHRKVPRARFDLRAVG